MNYQQKKEKKKTLVESVQQSPIVLDYVFSFSLSGDGLGDEVCYFALAFNSLPYPDLLLCLES